MIKSTGVQSPNEPRCIPWRSCVYVNDPTQCPLFLYLNKIRVLTYMDSYCYENAVVISFIDKGESYIDNAAFLYKNGPLMLDAAVMVAQKYLITHCRMRKCYMSQWREIVITPTQTVTGQAHSGIWYYNLLQLSMNIFHTADNEKLPKATQTLAIYFHLLSGDHGYLAGVSATNAILG